MKRKHWVDSAPALIIRITRIINRNRTAINDLNLFPVPDSDTGTNLSDTLQEISTDIIAFPSETPPKTKLQAIARSANYHARGNSGTILASIITGIIERLEDTDELTPELLAEALENANAKARTAVRKPTEGTMLTVIHDMAVAARQALDTGATTIKQLAKPILLAAAQATDESAAIMQKLFAEYKNVGKDAGAFGLNLIVRETIAYMTGKNDDHNTDILDSITTNSQSFDAPFPENVDWVPGTPLYCTEFIVFSSDRKLTASTALKKLASLGNSEIFTTYNDVAKIHVHTDTPWKVFAYFAQYGELANAKIDNMRVQTEARNAAIRATTPPKPLGIVAIASGDGIKKLLTDFSVDRIVDGGQSNNPETGQIYEAIIDINAERVIVLPGNKNIIIAAERACQMTATEKQIIATTIPTYDIAQTITALATIQFLLDTDHLDALRTADFDALCTQAAARAQNVPSASITIAAKDYAAGRIRAKKGYFISLIRGQIKFSSPSIDKIIIKTIHALLTKESSFITVYLGVDYDAHPDHLRYLLAEEFTNLEVAIVHGDQPIYPIILSVD